MIDASLRGEVGRVSIDEHDRRVVQQVGSRIAEGDDRVGARLAPFSEATVE